MQLNKEYEPEINLRSLFFHVLFRWRSILVVALIGAVLLVGYKYLSTKSGTKTNQTAQQTQQEAETSEAERELNRKIEIKSRQVEELESYLNESIYIQLDPQGVWKASCKYLVKVDLSTVDSLPQGLSVDPADSILSVYTYPLSGASSEELMEYFNTDRPEYANELVITEISTEENTVTVQVKGVTKESVQKGLKYVQEKMEEISTKSQDIGVHSLLNVGENTSLGTDIVSTDEALISRKKTLSTALGQYKKDLQALLDNKESGKQGGLTKKEIIKFALIGFLAGIFLMIFLYAVFYVISGKLRDSRDISEQYNIPVFGEFRKSASVHNNRGLDKIIAKWELGNIHTDENVIYNNIGALIADHRGIESFLLTSSLPEEKLVPMKEALSFRIEDKVIEIKGSFLTNSEAITKAAKADAVILVEEKNVSNNKDIERMAETLMISQARVIGVILC